MSKTVFLLSCVFTINSCQVIEREKDSCSSSTSSSSSSDSSSSSSSSFSSGEKNVCWEVNQINLCSPFSTCEPCESGFTCVCNEGRTGGECDYFINNCTSNYCFNGGKCLHCIETGATKCDCGPGYEGDRCEKLIDFCDGISCGCGKCVNIPKQETYECECFPGRTNSGGPQQPCDAKTNVCGYFKAVHGVEGCCQNGGKCRDATDETVTENGVTHTVVFGYYCKCVDGFEGQTCGTKSEQGTEETVETEETSWGR